MSSFADAVVPTSWELSSKEMTPKETSPMAGIYVNIARRSNLVPPPQVDPHGMTNKPRRQKYLSKGKRKN